MDYDSAVEMALEEVAPTSELYDLFKNQVQVQESEAVIQQACLLLNQAGITQQWQLEEIPAEVFCYRQGNISSHTWLRHTYNERSSNGTLLRMRVKK